MVSLYARQARTWAELNVGQLRPVDELLPEMKKGITGAEGASGQGSGEGGGAADWATNGPQSGPRSKRSTGGAFEIVNDSSGGEGIRTPGSVAATAVFKTPALYHSAPPPKNLIDLLFPNKHTPPPPRLSPPNPSPFPIPPHPPHTHTSS